MSAPRPDFADLVATMARLRAPGGCPWDRAQTPSSLRPYLLEEAYETLDAIDAGDPERLKEELGDLLLQVVFHAQMAAEAGAFTIDDVVAGLAEKLIRRHPHVFGTAEVADSATQTVAWEEQKAAERRAKARAEGRSESALDGVGVALPALTRAEKLQKRAARVGFDWPAPPPILDKIEEEIAELKREIAADAAPDRIEDELGDLLFAVVNLARQLAVDPEQALRRASRKFERRFRKVETALAAAGKAPGAASLEEMEAEWQRAKAEE